MFLQGIARLTHAGANLVGPAYTLRNIPSREDLDQLDVLEDPEHPQRKSIETVPPGHVLVIDCRGERGAACAGDILITRLMVRGVAGLVSDGPVRDSAEIAQMDIPIYCAGGSAPLNLVQHHATDANVPIGCGGVPVYPGDMMVGDAEGVVAIPRTLADEVARRRRAGIARGVHARAHRWRRGAAWHLLRRTRRRGLRDLATKAGNRS